MKRFIFLFNLAIVGCNGDPEWIGLDRSKVNCDSTALRTTCVG